MTERIRGRQEQAPSTQAYITRPAEIDYGTYARYRGILDMGNGEMAEVVISGIGMVPPGEHWDLSLRSLAAKAILAALKEALSLKPVAMYIGNFLGSSLSRQANLGSLLTDDVGLGGIEGLTVEAAEASAAGAFRLAYLRSDPGM